MSQITPHFSLSEFLFSNTAIEKGITNLPTEVEIANLHSLAQLMEQVRSIFGGAPVTITSGFRCPALNRAVGGSATSAHVHGLAADFSVQGVSVRDTVRTLMLSNLNYDQLIEEHAGATSWVHIGLSKTKYRRETLYYKNGVYSPWRE